MVPVNCFLERNLKTLRIKGRGARSLNTLLSSENYKRNHCRRSKRSTLHYIPEKNLYENKKSESRSLESLGTQSLGVSRLKLDPGLPGVSSLVDIPIRNTSKHVNCSGFLVQFGFSLQIIVFIYISVFSYMFSLLSFHLSSVSMCKQSKLS